MPLSLEITSRTLLDCDSEVVALGVTEAPLDKQKALVQLDEALGKQLLPHAARVKFTGGSGQLLEVLTLGKLPSTRVLLVGLGKVRGRGLDAAGLRVFAATAARQAISAASLGLVLPDKAASFLPIV